MLCYGEYNKEKAEVFSTDTFFTYIHLRLVKFMKAEPIYERTITLT